jgi:hypothetical protein
VGPAKESGPNAALFDAVDCVVVPAWPNVRLAGQLILSSYGPRQNWADSDNGTCMNESRDSGPCHDPSASVDGTDESDAA